MKKLPWKWKRDWWKNHSVNGSGIHEKIAVEVGLMKLMSSSIIGSEAKALFSHTQDVRYSYVFGDARNILTDFKIMFV